MSAEPAQDTASESHSAADEPSLQRVRLSRKHLKVGALLLLVMALEAAGIYLILPRPAESSSEPRQGVALQDEESDQRAGPIGDTVEVEVGTFRCTNSRAVTGAVVHVSFKLVAIVSRSQQRAFETAATGLHKNRVRQAVLEVVRSANLEDLNDPKLRTIKRQTREKINKVLRKSYVIETVISEFTVLEQ